ncbi:ribosomal protein [Trifolium pratense]|uniref:Ribosomal protein n=1 Tax=Trifolium pratense TaxID=57577 RepID=A0A2K3PFU5_TRIPR|nr:ribosomal protein [Trifolium pratense]
MIVEDERDTYAQHWTDYDQSEASGSSTPEPFSTEVLPAFADHVRARSVMRDSNVLIANAPTVTDNSSTVEDSGIYVTFEPPLSWRYPLLMLLFLYII